MKWLKENLVQVLIVFGELLFVSAIMGLTWGSLSTRVEANTNSIKEIKDERVIIRDDLTEIKGDIKTLLERTKKL